MCGSLGGVCASVCVRVRVRVRVRARACVCVDPEHMVKPWEVELNKTD